MKNREPLIKHDCDVCEGKGYYGESFHKCEACDGYGFTIKDNPLNKMAMSKQIDWNKVQTVTDTPWKGSTDSLNIERLNRTLREFKPYARTELWICKKHWGLLSKELENKATEMSIYGAMVKLVHGVRVIIKPYLKIPKIVKYRTTEG
jgi:hypothetical protein